MAKAPTTARSPVCHKPMASPAPSPRVTVSPSPTQESRGSRRAKCGKQFIAVATRSKRDRLIALLVVPLIAAAGAGVTSCHSKATGGELVLTAAADPGANAFMPPAASPPPTNTQSPPTLQPQGDGNTVETLPVPGDRDGLYGGTVNNTEIDCEKI